MSGSWFVARLAGPVAAALAAAAGRVVAAVSVVGAAGVASVDAVNVAALRAVVGGCTHCAPASLLCCFWACSRSGERPVSGFVWMRSM